MAETIRREMAHAQTEADVVSLFDRLLGEFAQKSSLRWEPQGERRVIWQAETKKRAGRIDRLFARVIVEFEAPNSLYDNNTAAKNRASLKQVREYMGALVKQEGWKAPSLAGVVADGRYFIFCRQVGGEWVEEAPRPVDAATIARFLRLLLTFQRPPLLADTLVNLFGAKSERTTIPTVRAFYEALATPQDPLTPCLYQQWQDFFSDVAGLDPQRLKDKKEVMEFARRVVGRQNVDAPRLLFALYTYAALLIKLLAATTVAPFVGGTRGDLMEEWTQLDDAQLRERLDDVEEGRFFRALGIANFTEGDFFRWYHNEWTPAVARQVRQMMIELAAFDPNAVEQAPERIRDLLKRLYHGLFPKELRHDLGEYYTPDWLAERLLVQLDNELFGELRMGADRRAAFVKNDIRPRLTKTRFLDPACGSGTLPVLIIRRFRQWAREAGLSEQKLLAALLSNVIGFDLNPLAVISARANFLLAIADLLADPEIAQKIKYEPIELPIYLADSVVLPAEESADLFSDGTYRLPLRGVGKEFLVPKPLATRAHLRTLAELLRRDVPADVGTDAFLRAAEKEFALPRPQWQRSEPILRALYETLSELHRDGKNGLWADIAKNMFMPLFIEQVDFVVGNPPWVIFDHLPQDYRDRSKELWKKYGLFVHGGMEAILGKGKKDISTLLTLVAADLYLKPSGKLGFVIDLRVFKSSGAAQGFRRFRLGAEGDATPVKCLAVDDFSALQPFEGATTRTSVFVLEKGRSTTYPVKYNKWRKRGRASVPFTATLAEALALLTHSQLDATYVDENDRTSAWLTSKRGGIDAIRKVLGESDYEAHLGANTGGANAVYWLEILHENKDGTVQVRNMTEGAKREVQAKVHTLEPDLLYHLLRGGEVGKWHSAPDPRARILMAQDPQTRQGISKEAFVEAKRARTLKYLEQYDEMLLGRAAFKRYFRKTDPHWSMFDISEYTFARCKVVWPRMAGSMQASVIESDPERPVIPQETISLIACDSADEAHYICAMLNSTPFDLAVRSKSQEGATKSFGTPGILKVVRVPRFVSNDPAHRRLAKLSREAHRTARQAVASLASIEQEIDRWAAEVWGLKPAELKTMQETLAEMSA